MNAISDEQAVFQEALDRDPGPERDQFLDLACPGDVPLRRRVEQLLKAHDQAKAFLGGDASAEETWSDGYTPLGTMIGPYKVLEQIGEGGMGLVYMAEQQRPLRRLVALKIIKPGMDSKQVIARFEAERQALAMMDHPHIAKVLDADTTEAGRPYFVMELVSGLPITAFCDQQELPLRERLQLFIQVCQAVQHAHHKGIIHRDLKPSNVLVTMADATPLPKVIDFGIAKALGPSLTDHTLHTGFAQLVGTPLYMSPEQASTNHLGVDTRSDVYSLGVLLYELLTGTTPFDKETLRQAGWDEMRRIIQEEEPETVSQRLARTKSSRQTPSAVPATPLATSTSHQHSLRHPSSFRLHPLQELDWIVAKSLEKDRTCRYESASALAADIQRYLSDEPVQACPPSALYRFRKFARKHKPAITTATILAVSLLLGTTVSAWQAIRATSAEALATTNAAQARANEAKAKDEEQRANASAQAEARQRKQAEDNFQTALEAVDRMLASVSAEELNDIPRVGPLRRQILNDAVKFYQRIAPSAESSSSARFRAAKTWTTIAGLGRSVGDHDQAQNAYETAIDMLTQLEKEQPRNSEYKLELAKTHNLAGMYYQHAALQAFRHQRAEEHFQMAADLSAELGRKNPQHTALWGLAEASLVLGKTDQGIAAARRGLKLIESAPAGDNRRAQLLTVLGHLYDKDAPAEADAYFRQANAEFRKYLSISRKDINRAEFASETCQVAERMELRHPEEAEQLLDESIAVWRELCGPPANGLTYLPNFCRTLAVQGRQLRRRAIRKPASDDAAEVARLETKSEALFQELLDRQRQVVLRLATVDSRPNLLWNGQASRK